MTDLGLEPVLRSPFVPGATLLSDTGALRATLFHRAAPATPVAELADAITRHWRTEMNGPGSGSFVLQRSDPALALFTGDDIVRFTYHGRVVQSILVRERAAVTIDTGEEAAEVVTLSGPGLLAVLDEALVYPSRGLNNTPIEEDRVFSWASFDFDDTQWIAAHALGSVAMGSEAWSGVTVSNRSWPMAWTQWIWSQRGSLVWAPPGFCYFRQNFFVEEAGLYRIYSTADDIGEVYLDGAPILTFDLWVNDTKNVKSADFDLGVGWHVIAARVENGAGEIIHNGAPFNPAGFALQCVHLTKFGVEEETVDGAPFLWTNADWLMADYPATPPGMTPGEVLRHAIGEAQVRGALAGVTLAFTDDVDSAGAPWPIAEIATKVGTDLLTFVRELCGTYIDIVMGPDFTLYAYNRFTSGRSTSVAFRQPTDPDDPMSGNLSALTHRSVP